MAKDTLIPEISNWRKRKVLKTHVFFNLEKNSLEIIKTFVKKHKNYYICSIQEKNKIILCKKEVTLMSRP